MSIHARLMARSVPALTAGVGVLIGALLFGGTPAATQNIPTAETLASTSDVEIERFCSNIADAARDRRYALQKAELETLQSDINDRLTALEDKRREYEEWLQRRNEFLAQAEANVVEIYSKMRPDAAAERLAGINMELAAGILMKLQARQAGIILNEMKSEAAAALTTIMASAARKQDPS